LLPARLAVSAASVLATSPAPVFPHDLALSAIEINLREDERILLLELAQHLGAVLGL